MRELRFPKEVYPGAHVDAAMKVYARFGEFEREEMGGWGWTEESERGGG